MGDALLQIGKGLSDLLLSDGRDVFDEGLEQLAGDDSEFVDVASAVGAGFRAGGGGEELRQVFQRYNERAAGRDEIPVALHTTPIESLEGETIGLRVVCSDPDAQLWTSAAGVLVEASSGATERITTPFAPGEPETEAAAGVKEWVVRERATREDVIDEVFEDYDKVRRVARAGDQEAVEFLTHAVIKRADDLDFDAEDVVKEDVMKRLNVNASELVAAEPPEPGEETAADKSEQSGSTENESEDPGTTDANPGGSADESDEPAPDEGETEGGEDDGE